MGEADRNTKKIAIIGISAVFPDSENKDKFWSLIKNGTDAIREIPDTHWSVDDYYNEDKKAKDMTYCKTGGFIKPFDFDPMEFGIAPNNLEAIDSSQLLGLYASKYALEDAGYGKNGRKFERESVGVVLGVTGAQKLAIDLGARLGHPYWKKAVLDAGGPEEMAEDVKERIGSYYPEWQEQSFPGLLGNVDSGRISNYFDLGGMNCVIDAACASSLGAIDIACTRLLANREYMMLAGGIDTFNDIFMYMCFSKTPAMAPDGHAKPFSENGNGTCLGEGAGIVVLKRYEDAIKDGDRIYAVIDGIGSGSDGKGASVFAPQEKGQVLTIKRAYESADINPLTVGLIEAHGTGTKVGDGIEVNSLMSVFEPYGKGDRNCAVGSVKSQIGHCKAAAGVAGLIKIAMSLYNKVLPPTIKANPPLKVFTDENCHFYVNTTKRPWISDGSYPRRAGVSAFGFGGTNFHCVLEEFDEDKKNIDWDSSIQIITFSSDSKNEISNDIKNIESLSWEDFCKKANSNRKTFSKDKKYILTAVVKEEDYNSSNLVQKLNKVLEDEKSSPFSEGIFFSDKTINGKVSAIFPGQGSQKPNMLLDVACLFPEAVNTFDTLEKEFKKANGYYLSDVVYPFERYGVEKDFLKIITDTKNAQPALGAVSLGVAKVLKYFGFNPVAAAGHSYGELPSLCFSGKISEDDFAKISVLRGQLMSSSNGIGDRGSMCAVMTDYNTLSEIIKEENLDLIIANVNAPKQMVLSGKTSEIEKAVQVISARGITAKQLKVSAAFHSSLISDALVPFSKAVDGVEFKKSACDVYSNMTSHKYEIGKEKDLLAKQLANPVLFADEITNMYNDGIRLFVECGPGAKMTGLINNILADKNDYEAISVNSSNGKRNSVFDLALLLARLGTLRLDIDFAKWNPISKEEKKAKFTVKISGANYRKKKVIPPSNIKYVDSSKIEPQKVVVYKEVSHEEKEDRQERKMNGKFNSEIIDLISQMQSQTADLHRRFLENQRAVIDSIRISLAVGNPMPVTVQNIPIPKPVISPLFEEKTVENIVEAKEKEQKYEVIQEKAPKVEQITTVENIKVAETVQKEQKSEASQEKASQEEILNKVIEISADKTGYPKDMLSPEMDMESDLGIDSIKKVEIFSSLKDSIPEMPSITASDMGQIRTLKEASEYIASRLPAQKVAETVQKEQKSEASLEKASQEEILKKVIEISAEKTGYPKDMLSPEMDMESDLGIDSIKKVEIFSSLKDSIPEMPSITASDMGQIRTLKEASEYIASRLSVQKVAETVQKEQKSEADQEKASQEEILKKVIEISAEKTGYPKDMLSPEMDMESDLGIDSIKKVEIFSSLKDSIPEMPSVTASDMGQIRTLKDASEYIASRINPAKEEANDKVAEDIEEESTPEEKIKRISLKLVDVDINKKVPFTGKLYIVSSIKSDMNVGIIESGFEKYNIEVLNGTFDEKIPDDVQGIIFAGNFSKDVNTDIQTKSFAILKDFLVAGGQFVASVSFIDGQFGLSKDILSDILESEKTSNLGISPVFGGFAGLIKTASLEYPKIHAKAVDFDFHLINDIEKTSLIADVIMSTGAVEVGISVDGVKTIKLEQTEQEKNVVFDKFEKDDVVLVFGGGRGVTYSCLYEFAKSLPEDKRPCWVIVGRTDIDIKEKSYTSSLTEEKDIKRALMQNEGLAPALAGKEFKRIKAVREIISNIEKLRKFSSDVKYISADTSVEKSILEIIDKARSFGKIVGLIHGAGVLADKKIENKTNADFSRVLKTKANSAIFALKYLDDLKLLAFFSSSTARFGRIGQIDYSVGNEILNKIADFYKVTHKNTVVKSFNWGPWDGGMVDEGLKKLFASEGIGVIPLKEGGKFFAREIASKNNEVEIVVLVELDKEEENDSDSFKTVVEKNISVVEFPILKNHIINGKVVFPVALASELMVEATLSAYPGYFLRGFDEFKVNSGIKISETEELKSRILIENLSSYSQELKLKVRFETLTNTGKYKNNFSVNVLLSSSRPAGKNLETEILNGEYGEKDFYEILFHGKDLQGIDEIEAIDKKGIFAFLNSKSSPSKWIKNPLRSKWVTDPFSLDCAFQAMILWTKRYLGKISLPCYLGEFRQYRNFVGNDVKVRAYIKDKIGDDIVSADIYFFDKNDLLIAQIADYRCVCTDSIK